MAAGTNILPFPIYGAAMRIAFPWLDADGDLVAGVAGADALISKDAGEFAACTNEATEIITDSGMHYLDLTGAEMTADLVCILSKGTGVKTTPLVLYPRRLPVIRASTAQAAGADGTITLDSSASAKDDFYNGCYVQLTNNDPAGVQGLTRVITDYTGSTKIATIAPNWATNPTGATTFSILVPENAMVAGWAGVQLASPTTAGYPDVGVAASVAGAVGSVAGAVGSVAGNVDGSVASVTGAVGSVTGSVGSVAGNVDGSVASVTGAVDSVTGAVGSVTGAVGSVTGSVGSVAAGGIAAASFAAGAITAAVIADAAIDNATFAADVGSTSYATNVIALAADKAIVQQKLDHLVAVADNDDVVNDSIIAHLAASDGDWSGFDDASDSLEALRDNLALEAGGNLAAVLADTGTDGVKVGADAIGAGQIADDAIAAEHIATGAIVAASFAAGAIDASAIAADAIGASELAAGAANEIADAILARTGWTAGGSTTVATALKKALSLAAGKIARTGDAYTFYDDDGTTALFTLTIASGTRTPS